MVSCKNGGSMGRVIRESSAHPSNYGRIPADGRLLGCGEIEGVDGAGREERRGEEDGRGSRGNRQK